MEAGTWAGHAGGSLIVTVSQTDGVHWNCYFKDLDTTSYTIYAVAVCGRAVPAAN